MSDEKTRCVTDSPIDYLGPNEYSKFPKPGVEAPPESGRALRELQRLEHEAMATARASVRDKLK